MNKIDKEKLRKLPPDERAKLLKEIKEKIKKAQEEEAQDLEEAETLLEEAVADQRVWEEEKAQRHKAREQKTRDFFKPKEELEDIAKKEAPQKPDDDGPGFFSPQQIDQYAQPLAHQPIGDLYNKVKEIQQEIKETGVQTVYQQNMLDTIGRALYMKEDATERGEYTPGNKQRELMTMSEQIVKYNK